MDLSQKIIVVTGASDGIGRETAIRLAQEQAKLALVARDEERLREVQKICQENGASEVRCYSCDVTDDNSLKNCANKIVADFGGINVLLNIAGVWQKMNYLEDIPAEEVRKVINTNLIGLIQMTRVCLPYLKEAQEAAIINFVSRSGVMAMPGQTIYCASKWGVRGFTETLKEDLKDTKVRVAGLYPAGIKTKILEKAGDKISTEDYSDPKDIAEVIVFILTRPPNLWLHEVRIVY